MLRQALLSSALFLATPAFADEIKCEGAFAADSSATRLEEIYGKGNVVTGEVPGPEGTTMIATTVFPNDPDKAMEFVWWDDRAMTGLSYVQLPLKDSAPGGLKAGLTVKEVEDLNGEPFTMTGFWWDYGGYAGFQSGKLSEIPGGCYLSASFFPSDPYPAGVNTDAVSGDREVPSSEPLLVRLGVKVETVSIGYPHPDFVEDEVPGDPPA